METKIAQKFILIPIERYRRMSNALKNSSSPVSQKETSNADESTAPKQQESILPETIKELHDVPANENSDELTLDKIIEHFPKRMQTRARLIGGYLQNGDKPLTWNKKGELIDNENPIKGSSIQDLLYDTTCIKRKYLPTGANIFYKQLHDNNTPQGLILNSSRRKLMKFKPSKIKEQRKYKRAFRKNWVHY